MGMLNLFSEEKELAKVIAENISKELPAKLTDTKNKLLSVNKVTQVLEKNFKLIDEFQRKKKMGFIGRSICANNFKWELKSRNYSESFVEMATEGMIVFMSRKNENSK